MGPITLSPTEQPMPYTLSEATEDGWKGEQAVRWVEWRNRVDARVKKRLGCELADLPDNYDLAASFIARMTADETAREIVELHLEEAGLDVEDA